MKTFFWALLVFSTLSLQAQTTPEWLADLRRVEAQLAPLPIVVRQVTGESALSVADIKKIAQKAKTPADLDKALLVLPTKERRDRAYATLISFTRWQPQPGFTEEWMQHGTPTMTEHK